MSLTRLVVAGAVGGGLSVFSSGIITGWLFHRYQSLTPETWRREGPVQYTLSGLLAIFSGAMVGLFYFVTDGVDPIIVTGWAASGLVFGFLLWLAVSLPSIVGSALYINLHRGVVAGLLLDSLVAQLLMGLACGWAGR